LLALSIEEYDTRTELPGAKVSGPEMFAHLMEENGLKPAGLDKFMPRQRVSEIPAGRPRMDRNIVRTRQFRIVRAVWRAVSQEKIRANPEVPGALFEPFTRITLPPFRPRNRLAP
jgi:hypothetical protein